MADSGTNTTITARLVPVIFSQENMLNESAVAHPNQIKPSGKTSHLDMDETRALLMKQGSEYSVFCYDVETDEIILVKTSKETDLYECVFVYIAQRVNAIEALYLPLAMAISLANELATTFPTDFKLVHLYNVGRCGSTLLCKAMNATEQCQSLSEPDIFSILYCYTTEHSKLSLVEHRNKVISIYRVALILLAHFGLLNKPTKKVLVLKYRSNCILGGQAIQQAYPSAKTIFLYRNAIGHSESFIRAFFTKSYWKYWIYTALRLDNVKGKLPESLFQSGWGDMDDLMAGVLKYPGHQGLLWASFCFWISAIEAAARLRTKDPENFFHCIVDYTALMEQKDTCIQNLYNALGIKFQQEDKKAIEGAFKKNSQEGASIQSDKMEKTSDVWYGEWERKILVEIMKCHKGIVEDIDYTFK